VSADTRAATVRSWDPESRGGTVLLDDGQVLAFPGDALQIRALRVGQRVHLRLTGAEVVALTIATLPLA
jgi:hypothetical protein